MQNTQRIHTHPGEVLREEFLIPLGISASTLADEIKIPVDCIEGIIKEKSTITADMAEKFAQYFGTSIDFWLNLQNKHTSSLKLIHEVTKGENSANEKGWISFDDAVKIVKKSYKR